MSETSTQPPVQAASQGAGGYRVLARRYRPSTFADLIGRYTAQVAALCRARVPRQDAVEDLVQETFLRALAHLGDLHNPARFGAWLYAIARNLCRDWLTDSSRDLLSLDAA